MVAEGLVRTSEKTRRTIVATVQAPEQQRFMLRDLDWPQYRAIAESLNEHRVRLTYDRGNLELMTLAHEHEHWNELLGQFIVVLTDELNMPRQSGGSTTFDREDLDRGIEPDRCYYLTNEPLVRGKDEIDLTVDPPPDLAIEIEVTRSVLRRMGIYAALRVPEIWRFDPGVPSLRVYRLTPAGTYAEADRSAYFPFLPLAPIVAFLRQRGSVDETSLVRSFRQWVQEQIATGWNKT
jgi:Uma2 family endonuclease